MALDYVKCQYCDRRFNESAAQRHIPFCKEKRDRIPTQKVHTDTAKLRNKARVEVSLRWIVIIAL